jgi:hypothetical protein
MNFIIERYRFYHTRSSRCGSDNRRSGSLLVGAIICVRHVARHIAICVATDIARIVVELTWWQVRHIIS